MKKILIIDYGSKYIKDIESCLQSINVIYNTISYLEIDKVKENDICGVIMSGGPGRVNNPNDPQLDYNILSIKKPILGICYGMQLLMHGLGGKVEALNERDLGDTTMFINEYSNINENIPNNSKVFMAHFDHITELAPDFKILARTNKCIAMIANDKDEIYAIQYHPEANKAKTDIQLFKNFVFKICKYKN